MLVCETLRSLSIGEEGEGVAAGADALGALPVQGPGESRGEGLIGVVADQFAVDLQRDPADALSVPGGDVDRQGAGIGCVVGWRRHIDPAVR